MGRPPLGKQAMSNTERQRRYWERVLRSEAPAQAKKREAALEGELAQAKQRIAALQAELAKAKKPQTESDEISTLQRQLKAARTENTNLKAKVRGLAADLDRIRRGQSHRMSPALHRQISACLHPDRIAALVDPKRVDSELLRRYHDTFAAFRAVKFAGIK